MSDNKTSVVVKVQVLLEVEVGSWTPETTLAQIEKQAIETAAHDVNVLFKQARQADAQLDVKRRSHENIRVLNVHGFDVIARKR